MGEKGDYNTLTQEATREMGEARERKLDVPKESWDTTYLQAKNWGKANGLKNGLVFSFTTTKLPKVISLSGTGRKKRKYQTKVERGRKY